MTSDFILDQRLKNDGEIIGELDLCKIILVNNAYFPWLILVPKRNYLKEIIDLADQERIILMEEISYISSIMQDIFKPDKLNVAALGYIVEQLHIHIIARFKDDKAWPAPLFGKDKTTYKDSDYIALSSKIREMLN